MVSKILFNCDNWKFLSYNTQVFFSLTWPGIQSKPKGREVTKVKIPSCISEAAKRLAHQRIIQPGGILIGVMFVPQVMHKNALQNPRCAHLASV